MNNEISCCIFDCFYSVPQFGDKVLMYMDKNDLGNWYKIPVAHAISFFS